MDPATLPALFAAAPLNAHLGFALARAEREGAEVRAPADARFLQEAGVLHGGLLATLADTAAVYALLPALPAGHTLIGIELKLDFLSSARPDAGELVARARAVRAGRTLGVARVEVEQAGRALAVGLFTYLVRPLAAPGAGSGQRAAAHSRNQA